MSTSRSAILALDTEAEQNVYHLYRSAEYRVVCVCGGFGFPHGGGSAARIITVGKALRREGIGFHLLHCGPSRSPLDVERTGVCEGVEFAYTTTTVRPRNRAVRMIVYFQAYLVLALELLRLRRSRNRTAIWLYMLGDLQNFCISQMCRLLGLAVVQELCEWWPVMPTCSSMTRWLYRGPLFRPATGALVISTSIERRLEQVTRIANPQLLVQRLPAIVDTYQFVASKDFVPLSANLPQFVWCSGSLDDWIRDVLFLVRAFTLVRLQGLRCRLVLIGPYNEQTRARIDEIARQNNISPADVVLPGSVDSSRLAPYYRAAAALLVPLWNDDKSTTRMPNKLPEFLASGRPVIASAVGDLTDSLIHGRNAYLAKPESETDFAELMIEVLRDPAHAEKIGCAGQQTCLTNYDYRAHSHSLARFFVRAISQTS